MRTGSRQAQAHKRINYFTKEIKIMKRRFTISALTALTMMLLISGVFAGTTPTRAEGAKQIAGIGYYAEPGACTDIQGAGASYVLTLTGSLSGCHYVFVETSRCLASGAYYESGTETFVGTYDGQPGTFRTDYVFTAKYADCAAFAGEVEGRCQHPFVNGSGTGVFAGIKEARLDMRDDVGAGNFPYRGHILF
jgi:hypothetical protein